MALELSYILGSDPETTTVTLYGFLQQNVLFDAFSDKLANMSGIEFLPELATIFSMIGLLVLIFSPHLWKAKYIISWFFLFIVLTLGASTGSEFGYNFQHAISAGVVNKPITSNNLACTSEEIEANGGYCNKLDAGDSVIENSLQTTQGIGSPTPASIIASTSASSNNNFINLTSGNGITSNSDISIYGFYPQVLIMYITNKLRFQLESALFNLSEKTFEKKAATIKMLQKAKAPDSQLKMWVHAFDSLCSPQLGGMSIEQALSNRFTESEVDIAKLAKKHFTVNEAIKLHNDSVLIYNSDATTIPVLLDFSNNPSVIDAIAKKGSTQEKDILNLFSIQKGTRESTDAEQIMYSTADKDTLTNRIAKTMSLLNKKTTRSELLSSLGTEKTKNLNDNVFVNIVIPKTDVPKSQKKATFDEGAEGFTSFNFFQEDPSIGFIQAKEDVASISNCYDLYTETLNYMTSASITNTNDLNNQVNQAFAKKCADQNFGSLIGDQCDTDEKKRAIRDRLKTNLDPAEMARVSYLSTIEPNCSDGEKTYCQQVVDDVDRLYKSSYVLNTLVDINSDISTQHKIDAGVESGYHGELFSLGKTWTDAWTGPLVGLKSLASSFEAGAYMSLMITIKRILIAFILVTTPIFFLFGLLVPSWAPGVIATPLVALLFIQMTDVTMVIVNSVLLTVSKVLKPLSTSIMDSDYDNIIELIWCYAYMATFGITAFLMFAVGNTKAIVTKMAGMDSTMQKASMDIAKKGAEVTLTAGKIAVGVASGGTLGGGVGMQAASTVGKAKAFGQLAGDQGLGTAVKSLGGSMAANKAMRKHEALDSMNSSLEADATAMQREKISQEKRIVQSKEAVAKAKDAPLIALDESLKNAQIRENKKGRDKVGNHAELSNIGKATDKTLETAAKDHHVDNKDFKGRSYSKQEGDYLVKYEERSPKELIEQKLEYEVLQRLGYMAEQPKVMKKEAWEARNSKAIAQASGITGNIAQGVYKNMHARNQGEEDGVRVQKFDSYDKIMKDTENNFLRQQGWEKDNLTDSQKNELSKTLNITKESLQAIGGKEGKNGGYTMSYETQVSSAPSTKKGPKNRNKND